MMEEVKQEARRRNVELLILPITKAIRALQKEAKGANGVLHVTC
jgi:hypothetical protein